MKPSRVRSTAKRTIVAVAVLALAPAAGHSREQGQSSLKAQLAAAQERHQRAGERYQQAGPVAARPGTGAITRFLRETDADAAKKGAEAVFERAVIEFGDVRVRHFPRSLGEIAAGELNAMRNLKVGRVAPDIEGTDVEGKRFKLSDFR